MHQRRANCMACRELGLMLLVGGALGLTCSNTSAPSLWPFMPKGGRPVRTPFIILFDGSAGSSWFSDSLDRHPEVFIGGYEPLEWVHHPAYEGINATAWQSQWLHTVWHPPENEAGWGEWLRRYNANEKLDPTVHPAKLTVRTPQHSEVIGARAIGFKVRPYTIESNLLESTIKDALHEMGGALLVINRKDKLRQAISLYRRRFDGKASQFTQGAGGVGSSDSASHIPPEEMAKMLAHRSAQAAAIECLVRKLALPTHPVYYEELVDDFERTISAALAHLGVDTSSVDSLSLNSQLTSAVNIKKEASTANGLQTKDGSIADEAALAPAPVPSAASPPCTAPNLDRFGANRSSCCDSECTEQRSRFDPAYHRYKLVVMCRVSCSDPTMSHEPGARDQSQGGRTDRLNNGPGLSAGTSVNGEREGNGNITMSKDTSTFQKRSPQSLCDMVSNFPELCVRFKESRYRAYFEPFASNGCHCKREGDQPQVLKNPHNALQREPDKARGEIEAAPSPSTSKGSSLKSARSNLFVVGTHHKTGTVLMGQVLRTVVHRVEMTSGPGSITLLRRNWTECEARARQELKTVCLVEHAKWDMLQVAVHNGIPLVHMLRDPVEVCVSGYQYHRNTTEEWVHQKRASLGGISWQEYLNSMPRDVGLRAECIRGLTELRDQAQLHILAKPYMNTHAVRLEDLSRNYSTFMTDLLNNMVHALQLLPSMQGAAVHKSHEGRSQVNLTVGHLLQAVDKFDLSHHPPVADKASHVSNQEEKAELRRILQADEVLQRLLTKLRQLLGYSSILEGEPIDFRDLSNEVDALSAAWWNQSRSLVQDARHMGRRS